MKVKLNFDLQAIQSFLLAHVEKFVFGLVVLLLLFLMSGAMSRTGYDKTPQDLIEVATRADNNINNTPVPPPDQRVHESYYDKSQGIRNPIDVAGYRIINLWNDPIWPQRPKRTNPRLYGVKDLRGAAGHGAVRAKPHESNRLLAPGVIGQRWVVITALIPYQEQVEAYEEAFEKAEFRDPGRDTPKVAYYRVERKELGSPGVAAQAEWKPLNLRSRLSVIRDVWNGNLPELVNPQYIHLGEVTPIAFPLPPLDFGGFSREVAHDPEIPLAAEEMPTASAAAPAEVTEQPKGDEPPKPDLPPGARPEPVVEQQVVQEDTVPFRLFRFFDFEVEPGKHYQYRVKLLLANPNWQVERQYLAEDSLREAQYLETEWSEPSDVISVPRDARVLLGSVKPSPGGRVTIEPKATVGIPYFFFQTGDELYERHEVFRGKYLNFPGHVLPEGMVLGGPASGDTGPAAAAGTNASAEDAGPPKVDFITDTILLDIDGGDRLPGRDHDLTSPGKILLLDPYGSLVIQDELEDKAEYDKFQPAEERKPRREKAKKPSPEEEEMIPGMEDEVSPP